jgi:hypothetical protein
MSRSSTDVRDLDPSESYRGPAKPSPGLSGPPTRLQRHWLSGEWQEIPLESDSGRVYRVAGGGEAHKVFARRDYEKVHIGLSLKPEDATPAQIAHENREARRHGTGAIYDAKGRCHVSTRGSQNRELRRRNQLNPDAGFGDYAGR